MNAIAPPSPASERAPHKLIARFAGDLARLWPEGDRLGLAVSGGPDSLALLLLAEAVMPGKVEVATVDHGLRPESVSEAAMVAELCAAHGIPHRMLPVKVGAGNVQARARAARYAALAGWMNERGLPALATAHHADDQAETLVMRLNRASGLAGLAGVRPRGVVPGASLPLLRPLLGWRRGELAQVVADTGLEPARDPSNHDEAYDRVRVRHALAAAEWLDVVAFAASAAHLAEADEALDWMVERDWDDRVSVAEGGIRYQPGSPRAIALRVVTRIVEGFGGHPRGGGIARLVAELESGGGGNLAGVAATLADGAWLFRPEPPRRA
jgi:tRNA(Ile)-lysidine synthase